MTCRQCQQLLSPHLDGVLAEDERVAVLEHLQHCPVCAEQFHQLAHNRQLVQALPSAEVTGAMELRLQAKIRSLTSRVESTPWWRRWSVVSVGTLATATASFLLYFSTLQAPSPVSAEEVVASMDQLLDALDPDDGIRIIAAETPEETAPAWREELDRWFGDHENVQE